MIKLKRLLCALTWHTWKPLIVDACVLCECSFCGVQQWRQRSMP